MKIEIILHRYILITFISLLLISCQTQTKEQDRLESILHQLHHLSPKNVLVAAHRGDWRNAPENSIQAIKNCINMGVDIVEIDVRLTKDSVLVLMHDEKIDRTTTGTGNVADWSLDSLRSLSLRNGAGHETHHKIPTLQEAMLVAKGKIVVNLDKCWGYMDLAYKILRKTNTTNLVIFKGSKAYFEVRKQYGNLLDSMIYMPIIKEETPDLNMHVKEFENEIKPIAYEVIYTTDTSPMFSIIQNLRKEGRGIWVNTLWDSLCGDHYDDIGVDHPDKAWGWVIYHGASIIQTDRPQELLEYLRQKNLHQ